MSSPEMADQWVWICDWQRFQHYKDRNPPWIKFYTELLHDEDYLNLTCTQRGLLHGLWLAFTLSRTSLVFDVTQLNSTLRANGKMRDYQALIHAGFIEIVASTTLAERKQAASATLASRAPARSRDREGEQPYSQRGSCSPSRSEETDDAAHTATNVPAPLNARSREPKWCSQCQLGFYSTHDLDDHMAAEHGRVPA